jgi:putative oxidoreductase
LSKRGGAWQKGGLPRLSLVYIAIYATGPVMVHMPARWFVVGLGRNGMEYSVLLIACLAMLAYVHAPRRGN